ncbi:DUF3515 domain-containing protein [Mycobacterium sp. SMC-4]|uniref:DUF3515 domain-containing protein n=1 Tax=Mycobacterium sp. SMC-4 TaxID=2857059 RepID=UPI0021B2D136|nr:DUF3515 domain-containing protein [Mycobacterium sp. SMC-4]UXA19723.1 DUF3515 domain-containing protein [Mycobacterium sp. SMC-4]
MESRSEDGPPRGALIAALVVAVGAVLAVLVVVAVLQRPGGPGPVSVAALPAPQAQDPHCRSLLDALPEQLGDYQRAELVEPAPTGAAAWQHPDGGEAVILRCGLSRPGEFVVGVPLQMVDAVSWLRVTDDGSADGRTTWFAVDRPVYVALTLPAGSGPTPIQVLSAAITESLPERRIDPGPPR